MDQETISRKEKIELARRQSEQTNFAYRKFHNAYENKNPYEKETENSYFFLRVLLSSFLLLAVLGVTKFEAMGEQEAQKYQTKLIKELKKQPQVDYIKELLK